MNNPHDQPLSRDELVEIGGRVAQIANAGLPMAAGLRALSEEAPSANVRRALEGLSQRLERGEQLSAIVASSSRLLPPSLLGVVQAGLHTGSLGLLLEQFIAQWRESIDRRRKVWLRLAYPGLLLTAAALISIVIAVHVVPTFGKIFAGFNLELPGLTVLLMWVSSTIIDYGWWILGGSIVLVAVIWIGLEWFVGRSYQRHVVCKIPLIGPLFRFGALGEFCSLLALLLKHGVPLPEALRVAGVATSDAEIEQGCQELAAGVERGMSLPDVAAGMPQFPLVLQHAFRWTNQEAFVEFLEANGQIFKTRCDVQSQLLARISEPLVLIGIAFFVGMLMSAIFMPLIKLLNDLS